MWYYNSMFMFLLMSIFLFSFSGLLSVAMNLGSLKSVFSLPVNLVVSSLQLPVIFLTLLFFLIFTFLPWGLNPVLNLVFIFIISMILFISINLVNVSKASMQLHLVGTSESFLMSFFFYFVHLLGESMKPLSLSLRLFINLMFGHMLIMLMCSVLSSFALLSPFLFYELFVFVVQSFIFATLTKIYLS